MAEYNFQEAITEEPTTSRGQAFNIIFLCSLVGFISVFLLFSKKSEQSDVEKRELAKFPTLTYDSYFSGDFTRGLSLYVADNVPKRDKVLEISAKLDSYMGIRLNNTSFHGVVIPNNPDDTDITELPSSVSASVIDGSDVSQSAVTTTAENVTPENGDEFISNGIIVVNDMGLMLFGGTKSASDRYAETINEYRNLFAKNVKVYNMIVPTSAEFYIPKKYQHYTNSQKDSIDYTYSKLDSGIIAVDAHSILSQHTDENIYLRTDHHWSHLGAYYAYTAFADAAGVYAPPISSYTEKIKKNYVGSFYGYTGNIALKESPEDFIYYMPTNSYTTTFYEYNNLKRMSKGQLFYENIGSSNCYGIFIGADAIHTKVVTDVKNGRKIAVFKESYGNAFATYLVSSFEEIYIIDIRYFTANAVSYLQSKGITDVLFINNVFATNTGVLIDNIAGMKYDKTPVVTTTPPVTTAPEPSSSQPETPQSSTQPIDDSSLSNIPEVIDAPT